MSGWFRTALRVPDPVNPRNPGRRSNLLEFETPIELERFVISNERPPHALQRFDLQKHTFCDHFFRAKVQTHNVFDDFC